jgi:spermidine synthase
MFLLKLIVQVKKFLSYCGGIPAPECADNPLGYMFTRSSREVLLALMNGASYIDNSKVHTIEGFELLDEAKPYYISPAFAFVAYPSLDSTPFRELYGIPEAETVVRGTLRYQGFPEIVQTLVKLGWLDQTEKDWLNDSITWKQITKVLVGTSIQDDLSEAAIVERVKAETEFSSQAEAERSVSCLRWIGIFSDEQVQPRAGNLFDILCARLEELMKYKAGERDLVMLQQKFVVEWADGRQVSRVSYSDVRQF